MARRRFIGVVISDKMQKTVTVKVTQMAKHAKYGRTLKKYNTFKAHDEQNASKHGDTVCIEETRPLSKDKRWRVVEIVKKSQTPHAQLKEEVK
jgi:small subunit ribosomal protein S17